MGPTCWKSETSVSLSETIEQLVTYTLAIVTRRVEKKRTLTVWEKAGETHKTQRVKRKDKQEKERRSVSQKKHKDATLLAFFPNSCRFLEQASQNAIAAQ